MTYEELEKLTHEQKREILIFAYSGESDDFKKGIILGMKAALHWVEHTSRKNLTRMGY